ncbi:MAG: AraC family transcriptional regulator, partial [Treponema sp.]|nr:AraC family transcriptional regulator [Treponema sp.]
MVFNPQKVFALRSQIIKAVMLQLIILAGINVLVYNVFGELSFIRRLRESAGMACSQIGLSYETTLSYMAETVNRIAIFDFAGYDAAAEAEKVYEFQITMIRKLSSIVSMHSYISSAYLYIARLDRVFDSRLMPVMITSLDSFPDREIFMRNHANYLRMMGPRILADQPNTGGGHSVITLVSPVSFKDGGGAYLAVNISMDALYNAMFKTIGAPEEFTFYVYNAENTLLVHSGDKNRLFSTLNPEPPGGQESDWFYYLHRNRPVRAAYTSAYLGWTFALETPVNPVIPNLPRYIAVNLFVLAVILGIMALAAIVKTAPVSKAAGALTDALWKEALLDQSPVDGGMIQQLSGGDFVIDGGGNTCYGVICLAVSGEVSGAVPGLADAVRERFRADAPARQFKYKLTPLSKSVVALIAAYRPGDAAAIHRDLAGRLLNCAPPDEQRGAFAALSGLQKNFALLPFCYKQCEDALKYKICLDSPILDHALIRERAGEYEFPSELARQLNNNAAAGSKPGCAAYLDKIFSPLENKRLIASDEQMFNLVINLQNGAFKAAAGVKLDAGMVINAETLKNKTRDELKALLCGFYDKICDEVTLLRENQERRLAAAVLDFVEKNCHSDHLISLVSVADELQISKYQVSRIIKEAAGLDFPEFINKKRIEYAKKLLLNRSMTIEEVAKAAGYNYSYYFIKIFKS